MRVQNKVELEKNNNLEKIADGHELEIEKIWEPHGVGVFTGNWAHEGTDYIGFLDEHLALAEVKFTDGKSEYVLVDVTDGHQVSGFPHTLSRGLARKRTYIQNAETIVAQYFEGNEFHVDGINLRQGKKVWSFTGKVDEHRDHEQARVAVTPELTYVVAKARVAVFDKEGNVALEKRLRRSVKNAVIHPSGKMIFVEEVKKKNQYGSVDKQPAAFMFETSDRSTHRVTIDALTRGYYSSDRDLPQMAIAGDYLLTVDEGGSFNAYKFPTLEHIGHTLTGGSLGHLKYGQESVLIGSAFLTYDVGMVGRGILIFDLEDKEELVNSRHQNPFKNKGHRMQLINGNLVLMDDEHIDVHSRADRILTSDFDFEPTRRYDNVQGVYRFLADTDGALFPCFKGALGKITGKRYTTTYKVTEGQSTLDSKEIAEASRF